MKKLNIVVYGNCQARILAQVLSRDANLAANAKIQHHFVHMTDDQAADWARQAAEADVFLVQDVGDWQRYRYRETAELKRLIRFPFIYFAALWPFDAHQNQNDDIANTLNPSLPDTLRFVFQDALLARLRTEIPDAEQRFRAYEALEYRRPINIKRFFETEVLRLKSMDQRYGLDIGHAIIRDFRRHRLFHTITHPTIHTTLALAHSVCRAASIAFQGLDQDIADEQEWYQVPLHPLIIKALQIEWADQNTTYRFHGKALSFEAYYRAYIFLYG